MLPLVDGLQALYQILVAFGDEVDDGAFSSGAGGAAGAVEVVLELPGKVVVDDAVYVFNIESAGGEVGGDEDLGGAFAEFFEVLAALFFVHVTPVDGAVVAGFFEELGEGVALVFGVGEDEGAFVSCWAAGSFD